MIKVNNYLDEFSLLINSGDKRKAVQFALDGLKSSRFDLVALYEEILTPSLYSVDECKDSEDCIWKEHVKTSIVRTIIECCYPYIVSNFKPERCLGKVIVMCPEKEYHEIGARMTSDFFLVCGFEPIFIGSNTPRNQALSAIIREKPKYVAISVTDIYLLSEAKKIISMITERFGKEVGILVGGGAFRKNMDLYKEIGADRFLDSFEDIRRLSEEG